MLTAHAHAHILILLRLPVQSADATPQPSRTPNRVESGWKAPPQCVCSRLWRPTQPRQMAAEHRHIVAPLDQILSLNGMIISSLNVYEQMSISSPKRIEDLKANFCNFYNYDNICKLTGERGRTTLAHIFPLSGARNETALRALNMM